MLTYKILSFAQLSSLRIRSVPGTANSRLFTPPTVRPRVRKPDRSSVPLSGFLNRFF